MNLLALYRAWARRRAAGELAREGERLGFYEDDQPAEDVQAAFERGEKGRTGPRLASLKPWWFCCGWRSYWCVADTALHRLHPKRELDDLPRWARWVCDRHDAWIMSGCPDAEEAERAAVLAEHTILVCPDGCSSIGGPVVSGTCFCGRAMVRGVVA